MSDIGKSKDSKLIPNIIIVGMGGAGGNAVNNMIECLKMGEGGEFVEFIVCNTDAQALEQSLATKKIQLGAVKTQGLGAGANPEVGRESAEESLEEIDKHLSGAHMIFITAGMGGGTGTGASPVVAKWAKERGILTVGVVTKPFLFEGIHRMKVAEAGIIELQKYVDTLIVIPNQNLFRIANERTTFEEAFKLADNVLYSGIKSITDLILFPGLINLDFADVRAVMKDMGKAMMGTGEASGANGAVEAASAAVTHPLLDQRIGGSSAAIIIIWGGPNLSLFQVDAAVTRIMEELCKDAKVLFGATIDPSMGDRIRVSVVAAGVNQLDETELISNIKMEPESKEKFEKDLGSYTDFLHTDPDPKEVSINTLPNNGNPILNQPSLNSTLNTALNSGHTANNNTKVPSFLQRLANFRYGFGSEKSEAKETPTKATQEEDEKKIDLPSFMRNR